MLARQRFTFPGVNEQDIVLERARERKIRRVGNVRARREIVARAQHEARFANTVNFRGFPQMPGNDFVIAYPVPGKAVP